MMRVSHHDTKLSARVALSLHQSLSLFALFFLIIVCLPANFTAHAARSSKPQTKLEDRIKRGIERSKSAKANDKSKPAAQTARNGKGRESAGRGGRIPHVADSNAVPNVTFVATQPGVEILSISGRHVVSLGKTGDDFKLSKRLGRGRLNIRVKLEGYAPIMQQQIFVSTGKSVFNLNFPQRAPAPNIATTRPRTAPPEPMPTPTPVPTPMPVMASDVINRYLNPGETESVQAEDWREVLTQTHALVERDPNNLQLKAQEAIAAGQLAYLAQDYVRAETKFKEAAKLSQNLPDNWLAAYGLGNTYLALNRLDEATTQYKRAVQLNEQEALAYRGLGDVHTKRRTAAYALASYDMAEKYGYASREIKYSVRLNTARLSMKNDYAAALRELQSLKDSAKTSQVSKTLRAAMLSDIGDCYAELKQDDNAYSSYLEALKLDPDNAWAAYRYGEGLYKRHAYDEALRYLERAVKLFDLYGRDERSNFKHAMELKEKADKKLVH